MHRTFLISTVILQTIMELHALPFLSQFNKKCPYTHTADWEYYLDTDHLDH